MNVVMRLLQRAHSDPIGLNRSQASILPIRRSVYLGLIGTLFAGWLAISAFVIAIDPFDFYPWGLQPKFQRDSYDTSAVPWIAKALTKSDVDTFYIGGSTSAGFRPEDMRELLPGTEKAFNLSMLGPSVHDLSVVMSLVAEAPKLRRAVVQLEQTFANTMNQSDARFLHFSPANDPSDWTQSLRAIDARSLTLAWKMLTAQEYFVDEWDARNRSNFIDWAIAHYKTPNYIAHLAAVVDQNRDRISGSGYTVWPCDAFPGLRALADFADNLDRRNIELDVVFPPYSLALYFEWVAPNSDFHRPIFKDNAGHVTTPLDYFMRLRACAVKMLDKRKNTKVFEFDRDDAIVGDYANYGDPGHINNNEVNRTILRAIADNSHRITALDFPDYEKQFRSNLARYQFRMSLNAKN